MNEGIAIAMTGFSNGNKNIEYAHAVRIAPLKPRKRDREFKQFSEEVRDKIIYSYLFDGLSHRELDERILEQSSDYSRGYLSMGILHHIGLEGTHKGIFKSMPPTEALQILNENGSDFAKVYESIRRHTELEAVTDTILHDIEAEQVEEGLMVPRHDGTVKYYYGKRYERDSDNRREAIELHGVVCKACGFDFEQYYGERGKDFIEIHHIKPLSTLQGETIAIDPATDLVPVCGNCHRMIHRRHDDVLTIERLKEMISPNGKRRSDISEITF